MNYLIRIPASFFIIVKEMFLSKLFDIPVEDWAYPEAYDM